VLTVEALRSRDVPVRGVVLNGRGEPPDLAESTNLGALSRLLPGMAIAVVPRFGERNGIALARLAASHLGGLVE
jgi:hypothetical protein